MQSLKVVMVGDGAVGKTSFYIAYTTNSFPDQYIPTVFDEYSANVMVDGRPVSMGLWDTAGQEEFDRLRPLSYPQTSIFIIAYSVANRASFQHVKTKWVPELEKYGGGAPWVLFGTKTDLRNDAEDAVTTQEGQELADAIGAQGFFEVSALRFEGLAAAMDHVLRVGIGLVVDTQEPKVPPKPAPPVITAGFDLCEELGWLVNAKDFHDVVFQIGSEEIYAHKIVLCSASEPLRKLIEDHVPVPKLFTAQTKDNRCVIAVDSSVKSVEFTEFLKFVYQGTPKQSPTNQFLELTSACDIDSTVNRRAALKNKINANLKHMWDVELVANDTKRFPASKAILWCRCAFLKAELTDKYREQINVDVPSRVLVGLLDYVNKGTVRASDAEEFLELAEKTPGLAQTCEYVLVEEVITLQNVFHWIAKTRGKHEKLHDYCIWMLQVNYNLIKDKEEFLAIEPEDRYTVMSGAWPGVNFEARLKRWRQQHKKKGT